MTEKQLFDLLENKYQKYHQLNFIENDPIVIPHQYTLLQDIEIAGFFAAIFAWGQRKTIINKSKELFARMDNAPYDFIVNHNDSDLKNLLGFKHRTFNDADLLYFISFFKRHFEVYDSFEDAFVLEGNSFEAELSLNKFYHYFFDSEFLLERTFKHIAAPFKKSACKRINMFLRWMVRKDSLNIDFGLWNRISMNQLICPCDVHVLRVSKIIGLIKAEQNNWNTAVLLTNKLKEFDNNDPVKYDYALFGMGVEEKSKIY